ncbi:MAG: hypothetical protein FLDDKLPJ_01736 [Phycisphaerae bacterium]|nr:hypothetical protein [Phycisphaerae bacterium]
MSLFDFLKRGPAPPGKPGRVGTCPSPEYPDPARLFEEAITRHHKFHAEQGWASFEADRSGRKIVVQVAGVVVNTCLEEVDMTAVLERAGLAHRAGSVEVLDKDLFEFPEATPHELARVVDAVFRQHYRLTPDHPVIATVEA